MGQKSSIQPHPPLPVGDSVAHNECDNYIIVTARLLKRANDYYYKDNDKRFGPFRQRVYTSWESLVDKRSFRKRRFSCGFPMFILRSSFDTNKMFKHFL